MNKIKRPSGAETATWFIYTDVAAVWGVGADEVEAAADARDWCRDINLDAPDMRCAEYRVAAPGETPDLSANWLRGFTLPEDLARAMAGSPGLVEV